MSNEGNISGREPNSDEEEEGMEVENEEEDDDDEREVIVQLLGNFADGFELALDHDAVIDDDDEEEEEGAVGGPEAGQAERRDYDKCLPSKHSYLGENLEEVRGHHSMPDDYEEIEIPLFPEKNFALVPGQVVPLTLFHPVYVSLFKTLIKQKKDFGVRFNDSTPYGTIAQIFEYCPEASLHAGMSIKARGCQRFKVMSVRTVTNGVKYATVRIQPEVALPKPTSNVRLRSLDTLRSEPVEDFGEGGVKRRRTSVEKSFTGTRTVSRMEAACTAWPSWVFNMYDEKKLAERVRESIPGTSYVAQNQRKFVQTSGNMPKDPTELSHWVARSLPFPETDRIVLLQFNSSVQRLRYELSLTAIDKFRTLGCADCGREIAKQGDITFMSEDGPQGVFVNMGGYVHDILTFSKLSNKMRLRGVAETEFSWFPGYSWRIGECPGCRVHLGWKFVAAESGLSPAKFFAILKNKISWSLNANGGSGDEAGELHAHS